MFEFGIQFMLFNYLLYNYVFTGLHQMVAYSPAKCIEINFSDLVVNVKLWKLNPHMSTSITNLNILNYEHFAFLLL